MKKDSIPMQVAEGISLMVSITYLSVSLVLTWRLVLLSENGELKKPLTMLMTGSVTYFSRDVSACLRSVVVLQTCRERGGNNEI